MICNTTNSPAPGKPSNPTKIEVNILIPIWKLKFAPIALIIKIHTPPKIEFKINLSILFSGNINILPKINKKTIQQPKVIKLLESKINHFLFY